MRDSLHYQARADQFMRHAATALTEVERRGYLELVERYRKLAAEAPPSEGEGRTAAPGNDPPRSRPGVTIQKNQKLAP
jgi:hypothetical protein